LNLLHIAQANRGLTVQPAIPHGSEYSNRLRRGKRQFG